MNIVRPIRALGKAIYDMVQHDGIEHAGYLAFLLMLCIFPFLVFMMALLGVFGSEELGSLLVSIILESPWAGFIDALKPRIVEITSTPPQSFLTIAIISAVWTASSIFEAIRMILNRAHRVTQMPHYLSRRLISILEFLVVISVTISMLLLLVVLPYVIEALQSSLKFVPEKLIHFLAPSSRLLRIMVLILFSTGLVAGMYSRLPNQTIPLKKAIPGTIVTMIGWYTASFGFRYYLTNFPQVNLIYGSIAGVIIALLYFYICSIVFIVGGEFNYHYYRTRDR
jgi:membrane protein